METHSINMKESSKLESLNTCMLCSPFSIRSNVMYAQRITVTLKKVAGMEVVLAVVLLF